MKINTSFKVCGIYQIINTKTQRVYIGSSKYIYKRLASHFSALRGNWHSNKYLQNSFNKHGENVFTANVLEQCPIEELKKREKFYISRFQKKFNLIEGTSGPIKLPTPNAERLQKVREKLLGSKRNLEQRQRMSKSHKNIPLSKSHKEKISAALSKFYSTPEWRKIASIKSLGKKFPYRRKKEWIKKLCACGCGREFEIQPHLAKTRKYSSIQCKNLAQIGQTPWNKGSKKDTRS